MKNVRKIQRTITWCALWIILIHLIRPSLNIDTITITLIIIAIVPRIAPLFKSVEFPWWLKFEFQELKELEEDAKKAGLITKARSDTPKYSFLEISSTEPTLAVAGVRIELEKILKRLAEKHGLQDNNRRKISDLINQLREKEILTNSEVSVLKDMIWILNSAVHWEILHPSAINRVLEISWEVLDTLQSKFS